MAFVPWASNQQCQPATTSVGAFLSPASDPAGNSPNSSPTMKVLHRKSTPGLWRCLPAGEVQVRCAAKFCSLPACCSRKIFTQGETRPLRRSTRATRGVLPQERQERLVGCFNQCRAQENHIRGGSQPPTPRRGGRGIVTGMSYRSRYVRTNTHTLHSPDVRRSCTGIPVA